MFIDEAVIYVAGGDGGNGAVSFRRERGEPFGGPDGGRGGNGGHVILKAESGANTLIDFQFQRHYRAGRGAHGSGAQKHGANGRDRVVSVPPGTLVYDDETGELLADLATPGQTFVVARGGRGGRGNKHFATATRRAPKFAERGDAGEHRRLRLELKLLAEVGLIGFPNAGKSTLISRLSAARPKIAEYPFTTLVPHLGAVRLEQGESFVVADIPGLIEGAHEGRGLGDRFLRHVERTAILVHVLDLSMPEDRDPVSDFHRLNNELAKYSAELAGRPQLVVLNKLDLPDARACLDLYADKLEALGPPLFPISAVTGEGIPALVGAMAEAVRTRRREHPSPSPSPAAAPRRREPLMVSQVEPGVWRISGAGVEKMTARFDLENFEAVRHLHKLLERMGVMEELVTQGAKEGDRVRIGEVELTYLE